ncbi:MAG: hypothetical protein A2297_02950 [Elusimicrobia bacterium RIFOXYB2_FULL_48_7]|nr:MAG: hypothetical protein A2297_02950 [Elusimicrobia bacterium RIFOXYB2_FULL_48_7]
MATQEIKDFIEILKDTDIEELQWESEDMKISLKRHEGEIPVVAQKPQESNGKAAEPKEKPMLVIKSPMVGTFLRAQSPDYPPLVMEGNHIVPGQKVALIEAMKIMKDVVSSVKGRIVKLSVENGQPVEYGQELFQIDPENNSNGNNK